MEKESTSLGRARSLIVIAYVVATLVGMAVLRFSGIADPLVNAFVADAVATVVIFAWSRAYANSSFYDAYWSVAPPLLAVYWWLGASEGVDLVRATLATALTFAWGIRLTFNWARGWTGLGHEDWRYVDIAAKTGRLYWIVSFLGIHVFPTLQVFAGSVGLYVALTSVGRGFGAVDALATVVTTAAIAIETVADEQLRAFANKPDRVPGSVMMEGLWAYSRHPNYFGEIGFWWGLFLFGYAADPSKLGMLLVGPVAITAMFVFVSIPMMETRQLARKPAFAEHIRTTSRIVPWFRRA